MNDTRIRIRNNMLQVICPKKKADRFVIAFYNIDSTIEFLREFKKSDIVSLRNNTYYGQISNNDILLEFDICKSNIPYINIGNIANYLLETL